MDNQNTAGLNGHEGLRQLARQTAIDIARVGGSQMPLGMRVEIPSQFRFNHRGLPFTRFGAKEHLRILVNQELRGDKVLA